MCDQFNDMLSEMADFEDVEEKSIYDHWSSGKRVPYLGAFWRNLNFDEPIRIGISGSGMVGLMVTNKWYYPERTLTEEEQAEFVKLLDIGYVYYKNGNISQCQKELEKIWLLCDKWNNYCEDVDIPSTDPEERGVWWQT